MWRYTTARAKRDMGGLGGHPQERSIDEVSHFCSESPSSIDVEAYDGPSEARHGGSGGSPPRNARLLPSSLTDVW
jgi:hypothetical protein